MLNLIEINKFVQIQTSQTVREYSPTGWHLTKQVNRVFQKQLNEKLKKKEIILTEMRKPNLKADSNDFFC